MDTSEMQVPLKGAVKFFKAGLQSKTWDIHGMPHFVTTMHCEGCNMCEAYTLHIVEASRVLTVVKFLRSPSDCWDPIWPKIDPLPLLQLHSNHPPILQHYANQNPELQVPPKPSNTFYIALQTPKNLRKPWSHFCLHLSSSFHFSPLELQTCFHVFVSVFTFPFSVY